MILGENQESAPFLVGIRMELGITSNDLDEWMEYYMNGFGSLKG